LNQRIREKRTKEIYLLSNFTSDFVFLGLQDKVSSLNQDYILEKSDFNQIIQFLESLANESVNDRFVFILTRAEDFNQNLLFNDSLISQSKNEEKYDIFLQLLAKICHGKKGTFFISNLFTLGPSLKNFAHNPLKYGTKFSKCNKLLENFLGDNPNFIYFDVESQLSYLGLHGSYNKNQDLLYNQPISVNLSNLIIDSIIQIVEESSFSGIKLIATDADNTLWKGVIGEDGINGIEISQDFPGKIFYEYQNFLRDKKRSGILLALVTKNNFKDIEDVFLQRTDMPLKLDDFVLIESNWDTKSSSISRIASTVNIGADSILFVDDSSLEIEEVKFSLPHTKLLLLDEKIENRLEQLAGLTFKWAGGGTHEDLNRTVMIKENMKRNTLIDNNSNFDVIKVLELSLEIFRVDTPSHPEFLRIVQLLNKTNQFNLTCRRFNEYEVGEFLKTGLIYAVKLRDKFGEYGTIGVSLIDVISNDKVKFSNLLMSCRALGRKVEEIFFTEILKKLMINHYSIFEAEWADNPKNIQTREFYENFGFDLDLAESSKLRRYYRAISSELVICEYDCKIDWLN
jgi:FkbH-like protein